MQLLVNNLKWIMNRIFLTWVLSLISWTSRAPPRCSSSPCRSSPGSPAPATSSRSPSLISCRHRAFLEEKVDNHVHKNKGRVQKKIKNNYGKFHNGSGPPPPVMEKKNYFFFWNKTIFLVHFVKSVFSPLKIPKFFQKMIKLLLDK